MEVLLEAHVGDVARQRAVLRRLHLLVPRDDLGDRWQRVFPHVRALGEPVGGAGIEIEHQRMRGRPATVRLRRVPSRACTRDGFVTDRSADRAPAARSPRRR